jgi:hypothetical protein
MALIPCRECGKDISTEAAACPHCGAPSPAPSVAPPTAPKKGMGSFAKGILIVGGLFVAFLIFGALQPDRKESRPSRAEIDEVTKKIFATCQQRVLGRQQAQGERITDVQATAITHCVDGMAAAYLEGVKAGRR